uniref:Endonuclease/exonuclease/phosphatase domain-containing protein n=1 Tax=Spongospora subterranea TaxID=70186 RepID=A0A0H5R2D0_9EUKA|eukprot:CRZ08020.1 hypothetical protein [Spongospora subterranea]
MNNPERPTRGNNSLDITIANRQMAKEILQWDVHAELGSDHSPTTIDTTIRRKSTQRIPPSRKRIQRIDTRATTKALEEELQNVESKNMGLTAFIDLNLNEHEQREHDLLIEKLWKERISQPPEKITLRERIVSSKNYAKMI